jgi:hypothetical protein
MGIKLFKKRFYKSAIKCFKNSEDEHLAVRSEAYLEADEAAKLITEADTLNWEGKEK